MLILSRLHRREIAFPSKYQAAHKTNISEKCALSPLFQSVILSVTCYSSNIKNSKYNYNSIPIIRISDKMTVIS